MSGAAVLGGWFGAGGGSGGAGRGGGGLISTFPCSFAAAGRVWFVCVCVCVLGGGGGGGLAVCPLRFEVFLIFPYFLGYFLNLGSFDGSWRNSCTRFAIVDVAFRFTCG